MTKRAYVLLGIFLMLSLTAAISRAESGPQIIELRTPNQISTSVGGVVLPKPQLDVLITGNQELDWEEVRLARLQGLANSLLEKIHFDFDSSVVDEEGRMIAEALAKALLENQDVGMFLAGHTDLMGSDEYNQALSERRAAAVQQVLVELGVPQARLRAVALGEKYPTVKEVRKERLNRRVEGRLFMAIKPVEF